MEISEPFEGIIRLIELNDSIAMKTSRPRLFFSFIYIFCVEGCFAFSFFIIFDSPRLNTRSLYQLRMKIFSYITMYRNVLSMMV